MFGLEWKKSRQDKDEMLEEKTLLSAFSTHDSSHKDAIRKCGGDLQTIQRVRKRVRSDVRTDEINKREQVSMSKEIITSKQSQVQTTMIEEHEETPKPSSLTLRRWSTTPGKESPIAKDSPDFESHTHKEASKDVVQELVGPVDLVSPLKSGTPSPAIKDITSSSSSIRKATLAEGEPLPIPTAKSTSDGPCALESSQESFVSSDKEMHSKKTEQGNSTDYQGDDESLSTTFQASNNQVASSLKEQASIVKIKEIEGKTSEPAKLKTLFRWSKKHATMKDESEKQVLSDEVKSDAWQTFYDPVQKKTVQGLKMPVHGLAQRQKQDKLPPSSPNIDQAQSRQSRTPAGKPSLCTSELHLGDTTLLASWFIISAH